MIEHQDKLHEILIVYFHNLHTQQLNEQVQGGGKTEKSLQKRMEQGGICVSAIGAF